MYFLDRFQNGLLDQSEYSSIVRFSMHSGNHAAVADGVDHLDDPIEFIYRVDKKLQYVSVGGWDY